MPSADLSDQHRLDDAVATYLEAVDAGSRPNRQQWLHRYPEVAVELCEFFDGEEWLAQAAEPLQPHSAIACSSSQHARESDRGGIDTPVAVQSLPQPFGSFELLEELGQGGMGVVYKARQQTPDRIVALKMIRYLPLAAPSDVRRFEIEAQATASLEHPNIVNVFEVGEQGGQPYFTMPLIDGPSLAACVDRFTTDPRSSARLMTTVARAVHFAHQRGVLHRDLKPANILLDANGEPHIVDFGLAKLLESDASLTDAHMLVGTPAYMAPEHTTFPSRDAIASETTPPRLTDVTVAADVYSLGAVLYALLTGRPPFKGPTPLETLRQVRAEPATKPTAINPRVDRDLETICLKCLEKNPEQRYATARELADDLDHWLSHRPIQARRPTLVQRVKKWSHRHRATVRTVVLTSLLVLSASTVLVWRAYHREQAERQRAQENASRADGNLRLALDSLDALYYEFVVKRLGNEPRMTALRHEFLERAVKFYEQFAAQNRVDPALWPEVAKAYEALGGIRAALGEHEQAEQALTRAVEMLEQLTANAPSDASHRAGLAATYANLARLLEGRRPKAAQQAYQESIEQYEHLLAGDLDDDSGARNNLARSFTGLGILLGDLGQNEESERAIRRALRILRELHNEFPDDAEYRTDLAGNLNNLAGLLADRHELEPARELLEEAVRHQQAALDSDPVRSDYRQYLRNHFGRLAGVLHDQKLHREAEDAYEKAIEFAKALVDDFPRIPGHQRDLLLQLNSLAALQADTGQLEEAEVTYRQILEAAEALVEQFPEPPSFRERLALAHYNFATFALQRVGELEQAEQSLRQATPLLLRLAEEVPEVFRHRKYLAMSRYNLGMLLVRQGRQTETEAVWREALSDWRMLAERFTDVPEYSEFQSRVGATLNNLAILARNRGDLQEARRLVDEAIEHQQLALNAEPQYHRARRFLRDHYSVLAETLLRMGDHAAAAEAAVQLPQLFPENVGQYVRAAGYLARCVALAHEDTSLADQARETKAGTYGGRVQKLLAGAADSVPQSPQELNEIAWQMATFFEPQFRDPDRAVDLAEKAVELAPRDGAIWNTLGVARYRVGSWADSIAALEKSTELNDGGTSHDFFFLAMAHWRLGEQQQPSSGEQRVRFKENARKWHQRAVAWMDKNAPHDQELVRFRAETEELMGVAAATAETPETTRDDHTSEGGKDPD